MEWQDIRAALSAVEPPFPHAAAAEARVRWDEFVPLFVAEIERVADGGSTTQDEEGGEWDGLFSFAIYLTESSTARTSTPPLPVCCPLLNCGQRYTFASVQFFQADIGFLDCVFCMLQPVAQNELNHLRRRSPGVPRQLLDSARDCGRDGECDIRHTKTPFDDLI